jgi:hypothetical protein
MATVTKDFRVKAGLVVEGSTATVNGKNIITAGVVDAKGDLIVGSADDAVARLAVGTDNYILTADSSATNGVAWKAPQAVGVFGESIVFEGATANNFETTLSVTDPTSDREIVFPDANGTVALTSDITTAVDGLDTDDIEEGATNKYFATGLVDDHLSGGNGINYSSGEISVVLGTGVTFAQGAIEVDRSTVDTWYDPAGSASAAAGDLTDHENATEAHGATGAVVGTTNTQTLTNKTLTSPKINENVALTATATELNILDGATLSTAELNYVDGVTSAIQTQLDAKLPKAGGTMSGAIEMGTNKITGLGAPTSANDAATKTYVDGVITNLVDGAPDLLNTLNELAAAINDDANYSTTLTTALGNKQDKVANVSDTEIGYLDGVTSSIQTQLNDKSTASKTETLTNKTISGADNTLTVRIANDVSGLGTGVATFLGTPSSANLAAAVTDETGTGTLVFTNSPTLVTPVLGAATATTIAFGDALIGSNTGTAGTSATNIDAWAVSEYSAAKYVVQLKKSGDIEVIEVLVAVDGSNNVYLTEYANVQSNGQLGTTNASYDGSGSVVLQVTAASADTSVKVSKTYIEA